MTQIKNYSDDQSLATDKLPDTSPVESEELESSDTEGSLVDYDLDLEEYYYQHRNDH